MQHALGVGIFERLHNLLADLGHALEKGLARLDATGAIDGSVQGGTVQDGMGLDHGGGEVGSSEMLVSESVAGAGRHLGVGNGKPAGIEVTCEASGLVVVGLGGRIDGWPGHLSGTSELGDDCVEAAALDKLHHVEVNALVFAHTVDGDDVGVVQPGGRLSLSFETKNVFGKQESARRQDLEGDFPAEGFLLRLDRRRPCRRGRSFPGCETRRGARAAASAGGFKTADVHGGHVVGWGGRLVGVVGGLEEPVELAGKLREAGGVFVDARGFAATAPGGDFACDILQRPVIRAIHNVHEPWLHSPTTRRGLSKGALPLLERDRADIDRSRRTSSFNINYTVGAGTETLRRHFRLAKSSRFLTGDSGRAILLAPRRARNRTPEEGSREVIRSKPIVKSAHSDFHAIPREGARCRTMSSNETSKM